MCQECVHREYTGCVQVEIGGTSTPHPTPNPCIQALLPSILCGQGQFTLSLSELWEDTCEGLLVPLVEVHPWQDSG